MVAIELTIDGKVKKFEKKELFIRENIAAMQFSFKQNKYLNKEDQTEEDIEENQTNFADFISYVFNREFTAEEFINGCTIKDSKKAENIYIECLGGKSDDEKKDQA
ncbi:phage tail assembly chaperone G [Carnobacterium antarcticum]|uniref:Phage tail assembly chaperone G n=1 Tax=Carnobacterium antarcticum TaxID=2126436 RepID=A0ABW4NPE4_9LACT|nr:hypothetical protein [Carnobacterium sp. CP1]ALV21063.1 hypothetical protein NY10_443 [Carnobacterium sp. CP1]